MIRYVCYTVYSPFLLLFLSSSFSHDTSAYSLASAIYYLSKHPDIQEKARQEVNSILCPNGELKEDILPTYEDTKKFHFVTQIIKETLRISKL